MSINSRIIVALDFNDRETVLNLVRQLDPQLCRLKIGNILFTRYGPVLVNELMQLGFELFLDLKYHDIPHTVAEACRAAAELGVWMLTVHVTGGEAMLHAARDAILRHSSKTNKTLVMGVTVLTSLNNADLAALSVTETVPSMVTRLTQFAVNAGLDGVICSGQEVSLLRPHVPADFLLVTPGIRLPGDITDDQKRAVTPAQAIAAGADYLVIGRSITSSLDPLAVLLAINADIKNFKQAY